MQTIAAVHPLQPRFAQAVTGVLCLEAAIFQVWPVVGVALGLIVLNLAGPRWSPVGWLFRMIAPPPKEMEPVAPVRFAQGMAVAMLAASLVLVALGLELAAWVIVWAVSIVALFSAISGICVGCEIYRLLLASRRGDERADLRAPLGLTGQGPWLVVLTAPGCVRCEPVAREFERAAGREVLRVSLAERPGAAVVPVRSVPAALAVGADGRLVSARAGALKRPELTEIAAAV
ncbi:MAG: DUF4395 family protein [Thermoleophilia bacterium]|jgi:hypothetical protein